MRSALGILVPVLLLLPGCDRMLHRQAVYVPRESGLTLVYENPAIQDAAKRFENRLQIRVSAVEERPEGRKTTLTTTTLQGQQEMVFLSAQGGWTLVLDEKRQLPILPEGFPHRVTSWDRAGSHARILGRATVELPHLNLPDDFNRTGVWVEAASGSTLLRTFYLPDIGEVESRVLVNGQWVCVNRLVSRGFTDLPERKTTL
jgi:hypothetical protein